MNASPFSEFLIIESVEDELTGTHSRKKKRIRFDLSSVEFYLEESPTTTLVYLDTYSFELLIKFDTFHQIMEDFYTRMADVYEAEKESNSDMFVTLFSKQ